MRQAFSVDAVCGDTVPERTSLMKEAADILARHGIEMLFYPAECGSHSILIMERKKYGESDKS